MSVVVEVPFRSQIKSPWKKDKVHSYLKEFDKSILENYPGLEKFEQVSPGCFFWKFKNVSYGGYELKIEFCTQFDTSYDSQIKITPVKGKGNALLKGGWNLKDIPSGTDIEYTVTFTLNLPVPFFLKSVAHSVANKQITKVCEKYIENIQSKMV